MRLDDTHPAARVAHTIKAAHLKAVNVGETDKDPSSYAVETLRSMIETNKRASQSDLK